MTRRLTRTSPETQKSAATQGESADLSPRQENPTSEQVSVSRFDPEERERLQHQEQPDIYQIKAHFKLAPNV
ncbi:CLUMA_CG001882, isoform A [Clunio marinus]|uniref:CLUMA_CG001882, isoform A n=1 Tax=Clunio marinus TaxID=568069 RepID=A0A1J1HPF5_9DIPT|nr:CLUMA_CG001882, isoform A [Clunio marinus]